MAFISTSSSAPWLAVFNMRAGAIFDACEKQKNCEDISKKSSVHSSRRKGPTHLEKVVNP